MKDQSLLELREGVCGKKLASFAHDYLMSADFLSHGTFESLGIGVGRG
jgi:hypothetical protein